MSGYTTPKSRGGASSPSTGTSTGRRALEHPAHRRLQSEAASSRFSSPSPSSERSARCRSTSLAPSSVRKKEDLDRRWKDITQKCLTAWDLLEEKYAHITAEEDDIVDITTLQIVVDRGVMRNARDSVFGENLSDEDRSTTGYRTDEDELGGWNDVSGGEDQDEFGPLDEPEEEEEEEPRERGMTEDDRWDLAEFLRKNAMMPNPDLDDGEEEGYGYPEVEFPGTEDEEEGVYNGYERPDRSESPDEEEMERRRHHRSGSMLWDSAEALFSDGVDMENEDELAAADSDLEEATMRSPAPLRVDLSPDADEVDAELHSTPHRKDWRVRSEERERVSASAGPSRPKTPHSKGSRSPSHSTSRVSTTSTKKSAGAQRRVTETESSEDSDGPLFAPAPAPRSVVVVPAPKKRGRPKKNPLPLDQGQVVATEPKKRGRPKGSKNRPKLSLDAPDAQQSATLPKTKHNLPKSRSLPSFPDETPTEAVRRAQAFREVRDSHARSEDFAGAMPLVTLDDLFSPPPEPTPARGQRDSTDSAAPPPTRVGGHKSAPPSASRQAATHQQPHRSLPTPTSKRVSSSSSASEKGKHRMQGERPNEAAGALDPAYYHPAPLPTRGTGVKHCKACQGAGGLRARLADLCRGRMGVSRCKFEGNHPRDQSPAGSARVDREAPRAGAAATTNEEDQDEYRPKSAPVPKRISAITKIRMSLGSEADDEASPSVHQRKLLMKRAAPPQISRMAASMVERPPASAPTPAKSPRARSTLEAQVSSDEMMIDPELLALDAAAADSTSPSNITMDLPQTSDESMDTPAPEPRRAQSVFREPAPSKSARGFTRPRVEHVEAPEPPVRDGYAATLYYRSSGSYRLCALCRRAGGDREKYAMYCPGRTQSTKLCSFEGTAPPKARAFTPAPAARTVRAETPGGKRRYIPRNTPAPTPGPTDEDSSGRRGRKRKRVNYTEQPLDDDLVEKENVPPRHLPTPSPSVSAPAGSTSISPSSVYRPAPAPASDPTATRRLGGLANARPTPPPLPYAVRGSSEALGWSWNRGSTPQRSILRRRPSESSAASEEPRSGKRLRWSHAPRSPSNGYAPAAYSVEPDPEPVRDGSEDELLLHDNSSPPADDHGRDPEPAEYRGRGTGDSPPISREWRIRAADAGIRVPHHTGRLPSTLLKNIGPVQPNASFVPGVSTPSGSAVRATNPHIAALMLPPPLPARGRIGLSPLSRELYLPKTPVAQSTDAQARRAVSSVPTQRAVDRDVGKRHWSSAPRKTAVEKDPDWVPGESD